MPVFLKSFIKFILTNGDIRHGKKFYIVAPVKDSDEDSEVFSSNISASYSNKNGSSDESSDDDDAVQIVTEVVNVITPRDRITGSHSNMWRARVSGKLSANIRLTLYTWACTVKTYLCEHIIDDNYIFIKVILIELISQGSITLKNIRNFSDYAFCILKITFNCGIYLFGHL